MCNKCSFKCYIGYGHKDGTTSSLNIKLPQLTGYVKYFNHGDTLINFLVADKEFLKKCYEIWDRIKSLFKKEFDKKLVYGNKYVSAKVNSTEFEHEILKGNKHSNISIEPKNGSRHEYLSVILLDSILIYPDSYCLNKYYPQIFLKNAYTQKIKKQHY